MIRKLFLILLLGVGALKAQSAYSIEWLRSGCVGMSKYSKDSKDLTEKETKDAYLLGIWLQGYLQAVEMLSYSSDGSIKMVPGNWSNSIVASKSLLAYLNEFEQKHKLSIPAAFEAKSFVGLWYDVKHPETKPIEANAFEQLFLMVYFPNAIDTESKSEKQHNELPSQTVQIAINDKKIVIPVPAGLERLDGHLKSLDDTVARMAASANNRVYALFGSPKDRAMIDDGEFPTLSRTVTVQHGESLPVTTSRSEFTRFSRRVALELPNVDRALSGHFQRIGEATSRAMTDVVKLKSTMKFGETKSLGVFASGDDFFCHSLLLHMKGTKGNEALSMIQATSVAVILTDEQVVTRT